MRLRPVGSLGVAAQAATAGHGSSPSASIASTAGGKEANDWLRRWLESLELVRFSSCQKFNVVCTWAALLVCVTCAAETSASTPYGKFGDSASFALPPRLGWWLMELPVSLTFIYFFFIRGGSQSHELVPRICAAVMCLHYAYRGWIFPCLLRSHPGTRSNFSPLPAFGGWLVTVTHGYLNAAWFAEHGKHLRRSWLRDWRFVLGLIVYLSGFACLVYHDYLMRELRVGPGPRYRIPRGGLFEYVTQATYLCELWTWLGFFLLSWGPNGAFVLCVSLANLVPRAKASHEWYLQRFSEDYAALGRRYLVPFVW